jgi:hypothetical protein
MSKKYITAVFEYEDGAELPTQITAAFAKNEAFHGVKITAVSLEDEIFRVEQLENQLA